MSSVSNTLLVLLLFASYSFSSDFGVKGLITMPSARMGNDGELSLSLSRAKPANIVNLTYQALPWVETTFRYSLFNPQKVAGSSDALKDRSYEVKARLIKEGALFPAVSIGIRDLLGTGVWTGEYIVASKDIRSFDFSVGLGWGRFAERGEYSNPLSIFSDSFEVRNDKDWAPSAGDLGGKIRSDSFFRGPIGLFGGVSYKFSKVPISAIIQYSSDAYERETFLGTLASPRPLSYGLKWDLGVDTSLLLSYQQNEYFGFNFSYSIDTKSNVGRKPPRPFYSSLSQDNPDIKPKTVRLGTWYSRMLYDFEKSGIRLLGAKYEANSSLTSLEIENTEYAMMADGVRRALLLSDLHLPKNIETIRLHPVQDGLRGPVINYKRSGGLGGRAYRDSSRKISVEDISFHAPEALMDANKRTKYKYKKLATSANLAARFQLFDPTEPLRHQVSVKLDGRFIINEQFDVWSSYSLNVDNNFSAARSSDSVLPHVRSDADLYLTRGESGLTSLFLEGRFNVSPNIFNRSYVGVLEEMFSGIGSEFLYHVHDRRWALGGSFAWVNQRDYQKNLKHLDYQTVTGFLSLYYATPFYNLDLGLHIGKYLAGDRGFTFEATRSFDNGFEIGAFFSKTNVSAEDFGEGSFDKGLILKIPFDYFLKGNSTGAFSTQIRSINRDGGRRLDDFGSTIWRARRNHRLDGLERNKSRMLP
ncbi:YjbH domain-containing protein [Gammaproteobacteria bacterium]|nr:YjbH domain-containing protein [Gammaproteobacteria bacterium]